MSEDVKLITHPPVVRVIGATQPRLFSINDYVQSRGETWNRHQNDPITSPELLLEAAGRICYASWNNPAGKTRHQYICSSIIDHAHGSVLEHVWVNLLVSDLPRSSQLELVRHGDGTAFSFESTRFTDRDMRFVVPPRMREDVVLVNAFREQCMAAQQAYYTVLSRYHSTEYPLDGTIKRKRAKEMARSLLPNALASAGVVSANARALRWIIQSRSDLAADLSMREFAYALYRAVAPELPAVFADAVVEQVPCGPPVVQFRNPKV